MTDGQLPAAAIVRCVLPAVPEVVYREWLDPDALADWMCPRPARPIGIELTPAVGGRLRIEIEELGFRFQVSGHFLELDRPRRLRFTWSCSTWTDPDLESIVTVTLEPVGDDATLMTIHHAMLPPDLIANHRAGWEAIAAQLREALSQTAGR